MYPAKYLTDAEGKKIPVYNEQLKNGVYYTETEEGIKAYYIMNNAYHFVEESSTAFTPAVETLDGEVIYNANGETIQKYYRLPVFKYKYVQMTDETAKNTILRKLDLIRTYLDKKWGIDIDKLRNEIQKRTTKESLKSINLKSIKD